MPAPPGRPLERAWGRWWGHPCPGLLLQAHPLLEDGVLPAPAAVPSRHKKPPVRRLRPRARQGIGVVPRRGRSSRGRPPASGHTRLGAECSPRLAAGGVKVLMDVLTGDSCEQLGAAGGGVRRGLTGCSGGHRLLRTTCQWGCWPRSGTDGSGGSWEGRRESRRKRVYLLSCL